MLSVTTEIDAPDASFATTVTPGRRLNVAASFTAPLKRKVSPDVTSNVSAPRVPLAVALISTDPRLTPVTVPSSLTVATALFDEVQVTCEAAGAVVPSLCTASAVNCVEVPTLGGVPTTI